MGRGFQATYMQTFHWKNVSFCLFLNCENATFFMNSKDYV